ncbi:MAG: chemotaxis protein CheX [Oscillospiraceae bacterium]|nr:chemotaxis protein CheX [Oscillospiraceae bacterium]MBQ9208763.1 chemotaxis protein CheX [Oscillospiraceae bacterium]
MFSQFFGNYLLNHGLVTTDQLSDALARQSQTRAKLGVLAINAGYMTPEQVDMVHMQQQKVDKRIGDIAVDMGYMTEAQVNELLKQQGLAHLQLGQVLVDSGYMTNAQFADALFNYKLENSLTDIDFAEKTGNKVNEIVTAFFKLDGLPQQTILTDYVTLLFKNLIRFVGDDFVPLTPDSLPVLHTGRCAYQKTHGALESTIVFDAPDSAYTAFASRFAGETLSDSDEMTDAANGEFLNLHDGLYAVNVSDEYSAIVNIDPQEYGRDITFKGNVRRISLVYPFGTVNFSVIQ